jgi:WD40 repeat protein
MVNYELTFTVPSPGGYTAFIEFSPDGQFLAVGDQDSSLYILDRCAGFHPTFSAITPSKPTALVWETSQAFYVGLDDGRFILYRIDPRGKKLVEGMTNYTFRGAFPITAMAVDRESKTLVLSVGPGVFAFQRIRTSGVFLLLMI